MNSKSREETWLPIDGFAYCVSDMGRVRRNDTGRILKHLKNACPYPQVSLYETGRDTRFVVHRLVAAAFLGPCPSGKQVNHKNGDKWDARIENLEYVTPAENSAHAVAHGLKRRGFPGEENGAAKLTAGQAGWIRRIYRHGRLTQKQLASAFGVCQMSVCYIVRGINWKVV